jgi:hypothetical protein
MRKNDSINKTILGRKIIHETLPNNGNSGKKYRFLLAQLRRYQRVLKKAII